MSQRSDQIDGVFVRCGHCVSVIWCLVSSCAAGYRGLQGYPWPLYRVELLFMFCNSQEDHHSSKQCFAQHNMSNKTWLKQSLQSSLVERYLINFAIKQRTSAQLINEQPYLSSDFSIAVAAHIWRGKTTTSFKNGEKIGNMSNAQYY